MNDFNVNQLQDHWTIGINQTARRLDPSYLTIFDTPTHMGEGMNPILRSLRRTPCFTSAENAPVWRRFYEGADLTTVAWEPGKEWEAFDRDQYQQAFEQWGEDHEHIPLPYWFNSGGIAVYLAAYMGFTRIGLIGMDQGPDYFFESVKPIAANRDLARENLLWQKLNEIVTDIMGVELFNLSSRSLIETLPRLRLEQL